MEMSKTGWMILSMGFLCVSVGRASAEASWDGGQPLAAMKLGAGARAAGMGMAQSAVADDAYALAYNPAGLAQLEHIQFGSQTAYYPLGRAGYYLSVLAPLDYGSDYHLGLSWTQFRLLDGVEARIKNSSEPDSVLSAGDNVFHLGLAMRVAGLANKLCLGTGVKFIQDSVGDNSATGFGMDLGAIYGLRKDLDLGLALQDFYTASTWNSGSTEQAPMDLKTGLAWRPTGGNLILSAELEKSASQGFKPRLGGEWEAFPGLAALRLGFNDGFPTAGLGLRFLSLERLWVQFDYAASFDPTQDYDLGGLDHRFSLTCDYALQAPESSLPEPKAGTRR
jgi:hypothetical protein